MTGRVYAALGLALGVTTVVSLLVGRGDLGDASLQTTFLALRGVRVAASFLAGAALAAGGVVVQGLFRNPLASPSILGTTAGASFGGQVALIAHGLVGVQGAWGIAAEMVVPFGCLAGALVSLAVLLLFLRITEDRFTLLLVGFILSAFFLSMGSFMTSVALETWELGRAVVSFSLGSVNGTGAQQIRFALPLVTFGLVAAWFWGRPLDLLLSGEEEARAFGVEVGAVRWWTVCWVSMLVAAAVSVGGNVTFVGLVVPHVLRIFVGVAHRTLLPASALAGGTFVTACDVLARTIPARGEIPLGVITGLVGAPVFLALLIRARREEAVA